MRWITLMIMLVMTIVTEGQDLPFTPINEVLNTDEFTQKNLRDYILSKKIKHPEIVFAQAILETGNFTSIIFKENNNLFGMKYIHDCNCKITRNGTRPTTATGSKSKHATYKTWKSSVDDYLHWQQMFKRTPIVTETEYYKMLGRVYAEDKEYIVKLKRIINRLKQADMTTQNPNGAKQREVIKQAKKQVMPIQSRTNYIIEAFGNPSRRNKAEMHLTVGRQRL